MRDRVVIGEMEFKRRRAKFCKHTHLAYCTETETVVCDDCNEYISPFKGLVSLIGNLDYAWDRVKREESKIKELLSQNIRRIATRKVDQAWRSTSMVPNCPHCGEAIFPEDGLGDSTMSKRLAECRRQKKQTPT